MSNKSISQVIHIPNNKVAIDKVDVSAVVHIPNNKVQAQIKTNPDLNNVTSVNNKTGDVILTAQDIEYIEDIYISDELDKLDQQILAVTNHANLTHRDVPDAHPIDAITDLSNKLTERPDEPIPLSEIWDL